MMPVDMTIRVTEDETNRWAAETLLPTLVASMNRNRSRERDYVPPMTYVSPPRSIAVIESEIRRAVVPALRPEQV